MVAALLRVALACPPGSVHVSTGVLHACVSGIVAAELVGGMKERIARIKSEFPYSMKAFLQNPERVEARKAERNAMIEQLKDLRARYAEKIRQLQG